MKKEKIILPLPPEAGLMNPTGFIVTDPQGSYTGIPEEPNQVPVQDVDDL